MAILDRQVSEICKGRNCISPASMHWGKDKNAIVVIEAICSSGKVFAWYGAATVGQGCGDGEARVRRGCNRVQY